MLREIRFGIAGESNRVVFHDCIDNEPEDAVMDVSEGDLPVMNDAEGDATTETLGKRRRRPSLRVAPKMGWVVGSRLPQRVSRRQAVQEVA